MDQLLYRNFIAGLPALRKRILRLSSHGARLSALTQHPQAQAALAGLLALGFAWVAHERSTRAGRKDWLRSHLPSSALIDSALAAQGFQHIRDPAILDKVWRNLPVTVTSEPEAWHHTDQTAFVFYVPDTSPDLYSPRLYVASGVRTLTRSWEPLGLGWEGLDRALGLPRPTVPTPAQKPSKPAHGDPRQLHY